MIPEIGPVRQGWIYSGRCASLWVGLQIITEYCSLPFYPGDQFCGLSGIGIIFFLICVGYAVHCCFYNVLVLVSICSWTLSVDLGMFIWLHLLIYWKYTGMSYLTCAAILQDFHQAFQRPTVQQLSNNSNWTKGKHLHLCGMALTCTGVFCYLLQYVYYHLKLRHWQCTRINVTTSQDG